MLYLHGSAVDETHETLRSVKSLADLKKLNIFSANADEANADLWKIIKPGDTGKAIPDPEKVKPEKVDNIADTN